MEIRRCTKAAFSVIGKEGSTRDGRDFIARLWQDANSHFSQIAPLAKLDAQGRIGGIWGLMSDFSRSLLGGKLHPGPLLGRRGGHRRRPAAPGLG